MSEQTEFLKDLEISQDTVLDKPLDIEATPEGENETETAEQAEMKLKNRRERRLASKLQSEREANIALNARLQAISESKNLREGTQETEFLKIAEGIYGNDAPEKIEATELLKKALLGVKETAKLEALEEFEKGRLNEKQAVQEEEKSLEAMLEDIEEEYDTDMSDPSNRQGFLTLMEKVSPKDKDGNIIEYADPYTVYELYESRKEKSSSRAKELASRSMTKSGASHPSKLEDDATVRYLKENGII